MQSAIQARQVRPLNEINGAPLFALELLPATTPPTSRYDATPASYTARLSGMDPRLLISGAACLTVEGMTDVSMWPDVSPLSLSIYPIVNCVGSSFRGAPDPYVDDLPIEPTQRQDVGLVTAFGFSIQPSVEDYDLVVNLSEPNFTGFDFTRISVHVTAWMGIHPAAHVPDALALFNRVQLSALNKTLFKHRMPDA